jgi:hypothetical protein
MRKLIVGTVVSLQQARALVTALERHAFGTDQITVHFPEDERASSVAVELDRNGEMGRGTRIGAVAGFGFGTLAGVVLWFVGGSVANLSPVATLVALILLGTLWGSILGMALGRNRPAGRDSRDKRAIVVSVEVDGDERLAESRALFEKWGAHDVSARAA